LGLVRTWRESKIVRGTYFLERVGVGTGQNIERKLAMGTYFLKRVDIKISQDTKRKPVSERHSLSGEADIKTDQDIEIK
jgi:hypothetical protein